jgi:hypothetical protein
MRGSTARGGRLEVDALLRELMLVEMAGLVMWAGIALYGFLAGTIQVDPQATLRFLLAVLILVFARRTYWEIHEWRARKLPPDERFGFTNPLFEHPRDAELTLQRNLADATGSSQAPG